MPDPSRRTVLAGTAAAAALAGLPTQGHAAEARHRAYRWRTAVIGGTGFVTGILFHPAVPGLAHARTDVGGAYRWDRETARWTPLTDHLGWDDRNLLGVEALAVDPAHPDRLYLALGTYARPWAGDGAFLRSAQAAARPAHVVRPGRGGHGNGAFSEDGGRTCAPFPAQPAHAATLRVAVPRS